VDSVKTQQVYFFQSRYDSRGVAQSFGAEALAIDPFDAQEKGWKLAKHFKLHLHTKVMKTRAPIVLDPLPGVRLEKIYSDFFRYLYTHTRSFFFNREAQSEAIWQRLEQKGKIEFVIAHPNGWTGYEQAFLRKAAVDGGLVSEINASKVVHMLTEGEASVHFVMFHGGIQNGLQVCLLWGLSSL
jgi:hypothetical protein